MIMQWREKQLAKEAHATKKQKQKSKNEKQTTITMSVR